MIIFSTTFGNNTFDFTNADVIRKTENHTILSGAEKCFRVLQIYCVSQNFNI